MPQTKSGHVLIVDDEPLVVSGLSQYLKQQGYQISSAFSVNEALSEIEKHIPDIVLLDLCMPEIGGMELLMELRQDPETQTLPVIVTSALTGTDDIVNALRAGANDYITKPVNLPVLLARIERHLNISHSMLSLERQQQLNWQMASTEELNGACNRRFLLQTLESEIHRGRRHGTPLSILVMDLDHQNESEKTGQAGSELVLKQFLEAITDSLRRSDRLCRYEGDEFCAILPQTDACAATRTAEEVKRILESSTLSDSRESSEITACFGIATLRSKSERAEELLESGIEALKNARKSGPNRICVFDGSEFRILDRAISR
jgi:diguanylate cyclase (GGDEF)-like protein